jgi:hypothetical protein
MDSRRTRLEADIRGPVMVLTVDAGGDVARTWLWSGYGHGRGVDVVCFLSGRGRGLDKATANRPAYGADFSHPNRDHLADTKSFTHEGVRLVCVKSHQVKATNGDKCAVANGVTLRQICCRILSHFDTGANASRFVGRMANEIVSTFFRLRMKARRPREIRVDQMLAGAPARSLRSRVEPCA